MHAALRDATRRALARARAPAPATIARRSYASDPNAPPKVPYPWNDPTNPSNWKEEHVRVATRRDRPTPRSIARRRDANARPRDRAALGVAKRSRDARAMRRLTARGDDAGRVRRARRMGGGDRGREERAVVVARDGCNRKHRKHSTRGTATDRGARMRDGSDADGTRRARAVDYGQLWPIALAPAIPALGIAVRGSKDPRVKIGAPVGAALCVLVFAHGFALSASTDAK